MRNRSQRSALDDGGVGGSASTWIAGRWAVVVGVPGVAVIDEAPEAGVITDGRCRS
jgi:hypothetical protein